MRWRAALAVLMFATTTVTPVVHAEAPTQAPSTVADLPRGTNLMTRDQRLLAAQMRAHPDLPPIEFWDEIARCETNGEWDRGKDWGPRARSWVRGGLGLAWRTTWRGYGGLPFGKTPAHASKWAQIIVANRVGFLGWQTDEYLTWEDRVANRRHYRPPAGFSQGWGGVCYRQWVREKGKP